MKQSLSKAVYLYETVFLSEAVPLYEIVSLGEAVFLSETVSLWNGLCESIFSISYALSI